MRRIVYLSTPTTEISEDHLKEILVDARATNAAFGVTGVLIYQGGKFFQCLEGPEDGVTRILDKIEASSLHDDVAVILDENAGQRAFGDWHMGFTTITGAEDLSGYKNILDIFEASGAKDGHEDVANLVREFLMSNLKAAA